MMSRMLYDALLFAVLTAALALIGCSGGDRLAGAGSQTTNGVTVVGTVKNTDGTPCPNSVVSMFSHDYKAYADSGSARAAVDTTDTAGTFNFTKVDSGNYTILARNSATRTSTFLSGLQIEKKDTVITAALGTLQKPGCIAVDLAGGPDSSSQGYVFVPGTDIFALTHGQGTVVLADVPAGIIPAVSYGAKNGAVYGIRSNVPVAPNDTTTLSKAAWKFSRRIGFNTSKSGAGIEKDLYGFPVLIRLSRDNFNFPEALGDGSDIRFAKADNSNIPFEIETWDSLNSRADLWVAIDTVFANSTSQAITMFWGASTFGTKVPAALASNSAAVFDTAAGFQGVWHLNDALTDSLHDATGNHFSGVASGMTGASIAGGVIGKCREFDGSAGYITIPNSATGKLSFPQNGNYTVSAWVSVDTLDTLSHVVLSKGIFEYYLWFTSIYQNTPNWEFVNYRKSAGWDCAITLTVSRQWLLLSAVRDGESQFLYINGELGDTAHIKYSSSGQPTSPTDLVIGRYYQSVPYTDAKGGFCWFNGKIDEVRVCSRSRSVDWNRLCYMNQRIDDKLITFK
jgi:hypothetical protein